MELKRFDAAGPFYARAESFLLAHEAEHNLTLGICMTQMARPDLIRFPPYFATVELEGEVVATAVQTPPYNLVLSTMESPEPLPVIAEDVRLLPEHPPGVVGPSALSRAFAELWQKMTWQGHRKTMAMRIYQLDTVTPAQKVPGRFRRAEQADRDLLLPWIEAFHAEALQSSDPSTPADLERLVDLYLTPGNEAIRGFVLWEADEPVSMAAYTGPTPRGIRVNSVYTPPEHREQGYASACVAALSEMLLAGGREFCFLFTDLANPTSNHIYQAIGYHPVCDVDEYKFDG